MTHLRDKQEQLTLISWLYFISYKSGNCEVSLKPAFNGVKISYRNNKATHKLPKGFYHRCKLVIVRCRFEIFKQLFYSL